jgi:hypothetical protein
MIYLLLNFLIAKVMPICLVLLLIASAIIFYFSFGDPNTFVRIKSLWRAAGIGIGIILFSWFFVDFILKIIGYNVGIFGPWWQFSF